ncbi:MAG: DUF4982 domain-containing protein, partial [Lachnospiraceae bacterium]|nr:DUF4982 domain-containing protein [Lachnospiraceae bacterium]
MRKIDFNMNWTVEKDGTGIRHHVDLPHDSMIYEKREKDSPAGGAGGFFVSGKYLYRKSFEAPAEWKDCSVLLECEAVYKNATVLLNGTELNLHAYGYTNFYTDLSAALDFEGENELTIIADNSKLPNSRWYSGAGVIRPVSLHVGPKCAILPEGIRVTTLDASHIRVETKLAEETEGLEIAVELLDGEAVIASAAGSAAEIEIPDAKLWSDENPYLYTCRVSLQKDYKTIDCSSICFGIRTLEWGAKGLLVNGKETLLRGACIHHDNGILGAAAFADAEERRVRILKEAGFNAIRSAHNPISKSMLDACDRLGMYVMDESFDMWLIHKNPFDYVKEDFGQYWKEDIQAMVDKDYSHPSVILYSIGNEISDLGMEAGRKICQEMADLVRSLDPTRPTTLGINLMLAVMVAKGRGMYGNGKEDDKESKVNADALTNAPTSEFFNILMNKMGSIMEKAAARKSADKIVEAVCGSLDMPGYNYASARYDKEAALYPERPFVGSETLPPAIYRNWQLVKKIPQLTGDFMWTGWDYLGEAGIGMVRYKNKKKPDDALLISAGSGVIDILGKKRPEAYWNRIVWDLEQSPVIGVEPYTHADDQHGISMWRNTDAVESWSWEGCEGKRSTVLVYAKGASAELLVNGASIGKKPIKEDKAVFKKVAYVPGEIKAVIYDESGSKLAETALTSASGATQIRLNAERTTLSANGQDLAYINIDLTDENGVTKSASDQKLRVTVEGPAKLQAFGS